MLISLYLKDNIKINERTKFCSDKYILQLVVNTLGFIDKPLRHMLTQLVPLTIRIISYFKHAVI